VEDHDNQGKLSGNVKALRISPFPEFSLILGLESNLKYLF